MQVFAYRMRRQMEQFKQIPFSAKFGGATGNFNAHLAAYPNVLAAVSNCCPPLKGRFLTRYSPVRH